MILADGKKGYLHLAPGIKENTASCRGLFQDMRSHLLAGSKATSGIRFSNDQADRDDTARQQCVAGKALVQGVAGS